MSHITRGSVPGAPAAPGKEAVMGLATPRAALCFVLHIIMLYCLVSASVGAATSGPRLGFLGFYMLDHHMEKSHHSKGKATGRKCFGSSLDLSGFKDGACLENSRLKAGPSCWRPYKQRPAPGVQHTTHGHILIKTIPPREPPNESADQPSCSY